MSCKKLSPIKSLVIVAAVVLTASGSAFADDNSMSMWTGDSYAYFNNLDNSPGKFNTARAPRTADRNVAVKSPAQEQGKAERSVMLNTRTYKSPFRDDTGA